MPQYRKQGTHLTKDQKSMMADFSKGSKLAESIGPEGKSKIIMAKWASDKQGNVRTQMVLADKSVGEKAFLTPKGGLTQTGKAAREAMLSKGIGVGDASNGAAIFSGTFQPAREKDRDGKPFMVGARVTAEDVKGMMPAQRNTLIARHELKGADGKVDPDKVLGAVNGRMSEVLRLHDEASKAAAEPEKAPEAAKEEKPAKNRNADLDRLAEGERTTVMLHVGEKYATGLEASNAGHESRYINLTKDRAEELLADPNTVSFEGPNGDKFGIVDLSAEGTAKTRNPFKSYEGAEAKWERERGALDSEKDAVQAKLDAIQADAADEAPAKEEAELEM